MGAIIDLWKYVDGIIGGMTMIGQGRCLGSPGGSTETLTL